MSSIPEGFVGVLQEQVTLLILGVFAVEYAIGFMLRGFRAESRVGESQ